MYVDLALFFRGEGVTECWWSPMFWLFHFLGILGGGGVCTLDFHFWRFLVGVQVPSPLFTSQLVVVVVVGFNNNLTFSGICERRRSRSEPSCICMSSYSKGRWIHTPIGALRALLGYS